MVNWHLTYKCNLHCKYCGYWENDIKELGTNEIYKVIDEIYSCRVNLLVFSGGEPLLREDLPGIIEYCKRKGFVVSLNTNGTLIKDRLKEIINVDAIKLSLDGPQNVNDAIRGEGVHDKVLEALGLCKEKGIEVSITTVISKHNIDYLSYILKVGREHTVSIYFKPVDQSNCGNNRKDISSELPDEIHFKEAISFLINEKINGNTSISNSLAGLRYFLNWPKAGELSCFASLISCFIAPDGRIFVCDNFPHSNNYLRPMDQSLKDVFNKLSLPCNCGTCWCPSFLELNLISKLEFKGIFEMTKKYFTLRK